MFSVNTKRFYDLWKRSPSVDFTKQLATFCALNAGPHSETLLALIASDSILELCAFELAVPSIDEQSQRHYMYARQCLAFYTKDADLKLCDTRAAMVNSFQKSEKKNRFMNQMWHTMYQTGELFSRDDGILLSISRKISDWLGDAPDIHDLNFGFGPGSSVNVTQKTSPRFKLDAAPTTNRNHGAYLMGSDVDRDIPHYWNVHQNRFTVTPGRLDSVPKNAETERSIVVEPTLATPNQKMVGQEIRKLLKIAGCDLSSQLRNQELALYGSMTEEVVTVDVKNASNSMFLLLVFHLITNPDWFDLLNRFRTCTVTYEGREQQLEMFSSMGNGFTFELESLIFYAIALVVCERCKADVRFVSVYGDDIIVPKSCYAKLVETLDLCGFEVNNDKTHRSGFFRESCGKDYSFGKNVRPWYKRDRWTNARVVGLLNFDLRNNNLFYELRPLLIDSLPLDCQVFGPDGYGDGHIVSDGLECPAVPRGERTPPLTRKQREKQGDRPPYYFETWLQLPVKDTQPLSKGDRLYPLYDIYAKPSLRRIVRTVQNVNVYGVAHRRRAERLVYVDLDGNVSAENNSAVLSLKRIISMGGQDRVSFSDDPYVLRGSAKARKTRIYCWSLDDVLTE